MPLTREELDALRAEGASDSETLADATRNILGVAWNMLRASTPLLKPGASVINVSTIFSRTQYYGRTAYVVPKAALNALSRALSEELGARGVRVNTVFPGPIESPRIRTVFAAMDTLRKAAAGTTAAAWGSGGVRCGEGYRLSSRAQRRRTGRLPGAPVVAGAPPVAECPADRSDRGAPQALHR